MNPPFFQSPHCLGEAHCPICRAKVGGKNFRKYVTGMDDDFECPPERGSKPWGYVQVAIVKKKSQSNRPHETPATWRELHRWALDVDLSTPAAIEAARSWLEKYAIRITFCHNCRRNWRRWVRKNPADLSSAATAFAWTVTAHNHVNAMPHLNKPILTVEEASAIYARP
jgi:hypothetical protein